MSMLQAFSLVAVGLVISFIFSGIIAHYDNKYAEEHKGRESLKDKPFEGQDMWD